MRWMAPILFLTLLVAPATASPDLPGAVPFELQLVPAGAASPRITTAWERDGILYLSANDLSILLDAEKFWRGDFGRLTLVVGKHEIQVTAGTELALVDGSEIIHLPGAIFMWRGIVMIPLDLFVDDAGASRPWIELPLVFSRDDRKLEASQREVSVSGAAIERERTGWTLFLEAESPLRYGVLDSRRSSFVIRIPNLTHDPLLFPLPVEHLWFQNLRLRNLSDGLEISFTPGTRSVGYQITHRPQNRVEVFLGLDERDLREGKLRSFASGPLLAAPAVGLVALDPGHGGDLDRGARVQGGVEEQLVWQLTMELADLLTRESGIDVVFTRDEDESPDPLARAETANRVGADVFISIHMHNRPGGPQAYVADVKEGEAKASATLVGMGFRSFGAGQAPHVSTSRMIARDVLDALSVRLRQEGGGVLGERLPQLGAAAMPAILIELGSGEDRKWTRERLEAAAAGIAEGFRLYLASEDEDEQ